MKHTSPIQRWRLLGSACAATLFLAALPAAQQPAPPPRPAPPAATATRAGFSVERLRRVDALLQRYVDEKRLSGAVALVLRDGQPVEIKSPRDAIAHGICLVTENRKDEGLVLAMPIRANVSLARLAAVSRGGLMQRGREIAAAEAARERLQIRLASVQQPVRELSGGNQQKVVLAKWLLREPQVLLLDEPTRGVDVGAKAEIHNLLKRMAADGLAVLVVSSDLRELMNLCDRLLVLSKGVLAGEVARERYDEEEILGLAYSEYLKVNHDAAAVA